MFPEKVYQRRATGSSSLLENREMDKQSSWVPGTPAKLIPRRQTEYNHAVNSEEWRETGPCGLLEDKEMHKQNSGVPGTPVNLNPRSQSGKNLAVNSEEKACNGASTSTRTSLEVVKQFCFSGTVEGVKEKEQSCSGTRVTSLYPTCLIDLNKSVDASAFTQDLDFFSYGELNTGIDGVWYPQLEKVLLTELFSSIDMAVDRMTVTDSQIDRSTKQPDCGNFQLADSLCSNLQNESCTNTTTEHFIPQDGQHKVQEDVASRVGVQNLNNQQDNLQQQKVKQNKRGPKKKPKSKKHIPKVMVEGKPKKATQPRTPKLATPKRTSPTENESSKERKRKSSKKNSVSEDVKKRKYAKETSNNNSNDTSELVSKTGRRALNFDLENQSKDENSAMIVATLQLEHQVNERLNVSKKRRNSRKRMRLNTMFIECLNVTKKRRNFRRRTRLNTMFMQVLHPKIFPFLQIFPKKRRRSRRLPRKCKSALLTATPICNQFFSQAVSCEKEETEIVFVPESHKDNLFTEENKFEEIPCPVDIEFHEASPLKHEDFSLATNLTGSQEVLEKEKFDSISWKNPLNFWAENESTYLQEVLQEQVIVSQEEQRILPQEIFLNFRFGSQQVGLSQMLQEEQVLLDQRILQQMLPEQRIHPQQVLHDQRIGLQQVFQEQKILPAQRIYQEVLQDQRALDDLWLIAKSRGFKEIPSESEHLWFDGPKNEHGTIVPYQEPVKARKRISAKVNLDSESLRMWNQLMICGNADHGKPDEEREKWWRREREVFKGRVNSFIARMHMILGDRRFKPWKGSIVDSVVGVYLTQNVADNLSSNAYMSLAATFPIQSRCTAHNGQMKSPDSQESVGSSMASTGAVYDSEGNMYFVTEPEPYETCKLKDGVQPSDFETEERCLVDIEDGRVVKDSAAIHTFDGSSIVQSLDEIQLSHAFNCTSKTGSMESSITSIDLTQTENRTLHANYRNQEMTNAGYISNQATRSGLQQPQNAEPRGKGPKRKEPKSGMTSNRTKTTTPKKKKNDHEPKDWELLRKMYTNDKPRHSDNMDSVDWEAVRCAETDKIAEAIKHRGQQYVIARRIKDFLNGLVEKQNCIDLEWLREVPPHEVKEYLMKIQGLGLKSVECVRLLSLQHTAFPVDTNVGRIAVRLGWVPLEPLPEEVQIHLLEQYPLMDSIQKYLWPRLCDLDQRTLYELHYQMITFGKVFCTKRNPNCGACPLRGECKHFASAFASAKLALPRPSVKGMVNVFGEHHPVVNSVPFNFLEYNSFSKSENQVKNCEPIVEEPPSPKPSSPSTDSSGSDIEDFCIGDIEDIPTIRLQEGEFKKNLQNFMEINNIMFQDSRALVALTAEAASIPVQKLKNVSGLRTEHLVYVLPDNHNLLQGFERRELDDPCPYLLAIWSPGETPDSIEPPKNKCNFEESKLCNEQTCYCCNNIREQDVDIVRGTILIPCRTANRGRFPLNGTYFQVNEVFADHETSWQPLDVPRCMIANLPTQTAYFGTSATHILKALDSHGIQRCFWKGFICVRGFDRTSRAPKPLLRRLHCPPSKLGKHGEK